MARPRSEDKRNAIMEAATRVIASQGLSASTALIAKEASIANGSLFTYFETKADLFNQLYLELKTEMTATAMKDLPESGDLQKQGFHAWSNWIDWAVSNPHKRCALQQLNVSDSITPATRNAADKVVVDFNDLIKRIRAHGSLQTAPINFVRALLNGLAEATIVTMVNDPDNAKKHCETGFETFWRAVS
jgi:AcrR family transcriptional regulator